ncbi:MAG: DUF4178 domain-containing protein, partial [Proteobacteria bacterium]|nr:DUF4178 domain-containing protein [Pseudomonadota bacterium]
GELTVIGYLQRSAFVDGSWWPFHEYLLYAPAVGFRWLVSSDSHWSYVQPIAPGVVAEAGTPGSPTIYDGVTFEQFSAAFLRVDAVYGECYWQVKVGELVASEDFIAPPAMISRESTKTETTFSLSTYLTVAEVKRAFADDPKAKDAYISPAQGVGANQPYPLRGWGWIAVAAFVLLAFVGGAKATSSHGTMIASQTLVLASHAGGLTPAAEVVPTIEFSEKFHVAGGKNLELSFDAGILSNNWVYAAVDLVNDATGQVISVDQNIEYYAGVEDGESWSEGDRRESTVIVPIPEGDYVMRVEAQHGGSTNEDLVVEVRQGVFRGRWWLLAVGCLLLPFGAVALHARGFDRRRRENANPYATNPSSPNSGALVDDDDGDD